MTGNTLKELLEDHGLNQKEAAEKLGVDQMTIGRNIAKGDDQISTNVEVRMQSYTTEQAISLLRKSHKGTA